MKFFINNGHKKIIINEESTPIHVNCHINDTTIKINLYSGSLDLNSFDDLPIVNKDLYDINYDVKNDLYVMDGVETDNISCLLSGIYECKIEDVKHR
ncbi:MAG: hypothetical protein Q4E69_05670 [Bacilli bacterium]|nr:hypothetical protein [Bacilli bacterium]